MRWRSLRQEPLDASLLLDPTPDTRVLRLASSYLHHPSIFCLWDILDLKISESLSCVHHVGTSTGLPMNLDVITHVCNKEYLLLLQVRPVSGVSRIHGSLPRYYLETPRVFRACALDSHVLHQFHCIDGKHHSKPKQVFQFVQTM